MKNLEMLPDDFEQLQRLLLKLNTDLNNTLVDSPLKNLNGQTGLYYFLSDLNRLINSNRQLLEEDLYMKLFALQKKLA